MRCSSGRGGVDKVVDVGGTGTLNQSLAAAGYGGEVALIGLMTNGDSPPDALPLMSKGITIRGLSVGSAEMYKALSQEIETHKIKPPIDRKFDLEDAKNAFQAQSSSDLFGKIVIELV